ncbi:MAG: hypothetical protein L3K15_02295, partial [Thermoplasmata archaeon]|nr:hypothetical protein [Thermoplasmata archaeon]
LSYTLGLVALTSQLPSGTGAALFGGAFDSGWATGLGLTSAQLNTVFLNGMHAAFHVAAIFVYAAAVFSAVRGAEDRGIRLEAAHHRRRRPSRDSGLVEPATP